MIVSVWFEAYLSFICVYIVFLLFYCFIVLFEVHVLMCDACVNLLTGQLGHRAPSKRVSKSQWH